MRPACIALAALLALAAAAAGQQSGAAVDYARRRAARLIDEQNYGFGVAYISEQRRRFPKDAALAIYLGECQFALGRWAEAATAFAAGVALDPSLVPRVPNHPLALVKLGRLAEAVAIYQRIAEAAANDHQRAQGEYGLALCAFHAGQMAAAEEHARLATRLDPDAPKGHFLLARILRRRGPDGVREAIVHLERVVALDGLHVGAINHLALAWAQLGDRDESRLWRQRYQKVRAAAEEVAELERQLVAKGRDPALLVRLADILFEHRRFAAAAGPYSAATALRPRDPQPRLRYAICRYRMGDPSGARKQLEQVLRLDPGNAEARRLHDEIVARFIDEKKQVEK